MKNIKFINLILYIIVILIALTGCSNSNETGDDKTGSFLKHEVFTDVDLELFQKDTFQLSFNGNTYTLGMTKDEIEKKLGEEGEGFYNESSSIDNGTESGNFTVEPDSYKYYKTINNYYYYPNNKVAVIYRSVEDAQETNNPAVLISVNNSSLVDSQGFSPGIDMLDDVKEHIESEYGENFPDITGGFVELCFDGFGNCIEVSDYVTKTDKSGAWITYYAYDGKAIDAITVGCKKTFSGDVKIYELWE